VTPTPHPDTDKPGVWVSSRLFKRLDVADKQNTHLKLQIGELKLQSQNLREALDKMTEVAAANSRRADLWESTAIQLYEGQEKILEDYADGGDPWWSRILIFSLGGVAMFGAVMAAKGL